MVWVAKKEGVYTNIGKCRGYCGKNGGKKKKEKKEHSRRDEGEERRQECKYAEPSQDSKMAPFTHARR